MCIWETGGGGGGGGGGEGAPNYVGLVETV